MWNIGTNKPENDAVNQNVHVIHLHKFKHQTSERPSLFFFILKIKLFIKHILNII